MRMKFQEYSLNPIIHNAFYIQYIMEDICLMPLASKYILFMSSHPHPNLTLFLSFSRLVCTCSHCMTTGGGCGGTRCFHAILYFSDWGRNLQCCMCLCHNTHSTSSYCCLWWKCFFCYPPQSPPAYTTPLESRQLRFYYSTIHEKCF